MKMLFGIGLIVAALILMVVWGAVAVFCGATVIFFFVFGIAVIKSEWREWSQEERIKWEEEERTRKETAI